MAIVTEDVREVALLIEREPRSVWVFAPYRVTGYLGDVLTVAVPESVAELAELNDLATPTAFTRVRETALLGDRVDNGQTVVGATIRDQLEINDLASYGYTVAESVLETASVGDAIDSITIVLLRETARVSEITSSAGFKTSVIRDANTKVLDRATVFPFANAREVAEFNDFALSTVRHVYSTRETGQLNDAFLTSVTTGATVRETALLADNIYLSLSRTLTVRSTGYLDDKIYLPTLEAPMFVGVSTNFDTGVQEGTQDNQVQDTFNRVEFSGVFTAPAQGKWPMSIVDANGSSQIQTGVLDMGTPNLKRFLTAYARSDAKQVALDLRCDEGTRSVVYRYGVTKRAKDGGMSDGRAVLAKGLRSTTAELRVGFSSGNTLESVAIESATSERRY